MASAMRSPKDLIWAIRACLAEDFTQELGQFGWRADVPEESVLGGALQFQSSLLVKWIRRRDQNRFAESIDGKDAPAPARLPWESARDVDIHVVLFQRQITEPR